MDTRSTLLKRLLLLFSLSLPITIAAAEPLAAILVVVWLVSRSRASDVWKQVPAWVLLPLGAFALLALTASALGPLPLASLRKCHRLLYLILPFAVMDLQRMRGDGTDVVLASIRWYLGGVLLLGLYDIVRLAGVFLKDADLFDAGNMRDPQFYMTSLCLVAALLPEAPFRRRLWAAAAVYGAGLVGHFKRGAWVGAFVGLMTVGVTQRRLGRVVLLVLVAGGVALALPPVRERLGEIPEHLGVKAGGRGTLWLEVAPRIIRDHPWGMGLGAVRHEDLLAYSSRVQPRLNHLHNNLLEVTLETGWLGGAAWLWWMAALLGLMIRDLRAAGGGVRRALLGGTLGAFVALMVNGLAEYNFGDGEIFLLLCLLMGWALAAARPRSRRH